MRFPLLLVFCGVLLNAEASYLRSPELTVPRLAAPPVADGKIHSSEYASAAKLFSLKDGATGLTEAGHEVFAGFDERNLYVAFRLTPSDGVSGRDTGRSVELVFQSVGGGETLRFRRDLGAENAAGEKVLSGKFSDSGNEGEFFVPLAELEKHGIAADGFHFNLLIRDKLPAPRVLGWSMPSFGGDGCLRPGKLRLDREGGAAAKLLYLGAFSDRGEPGCSLQIFNPSSRPRRIGAVLEMRRRKESADRSFYVNIESGATDDGQSDFQKNAPLDALEKSALSDYEPVARAEKTLVVPPGEAVNIGSVAPDRYGEFLLDFRITEDKKTVASGVEVFSLPPPFALRAEPYWLYSKLISVKADFKKIPLKAAGRYVLAVESMDGKKVFDRREYPLTAGSGRAEGTVGAAEIPVGFCRVRARLLDNAGKVLAEDAVVLDKPEVPPWYKNNHGKKIEVPHPWTPVQLEGTRVSVWGRSMDLSKIFPASIKGNKGELLSAPAAFTLFADGKKVEWRNISVREKSVSPGCAIFDVSAEGGDKLLLSGSMKVDFDGMVWYDLVLSVRNGAGAVELSRGAVELPLRGEFAELLCHHRFLEDGVLYPGGGSPKPEKGGSTGKLADARMPFSPYLWIGNESGGIGLIAEAPVNWSIDRPNAVLEVKKSPAESRILAHVFQKKFTLNDKVALEFAIQATPIRPQPEDHAILNIYQASAPVVNEPLFQMLQSRGCRVIVFYYAWRGNTSTEFGGTPIESHDPELRQRLMDAVKLAHKYNMKVLLFTGWGVNANSEVWAKYRYELGRYPIENKGWGTYAQSAGLDGAYVDFMAAGHAMLASKYGVDGVLWDSAANLLSDANAYIGNVWIDREGRRRPRFAVRATRDLFRRIYNIYKGEIRQDGVIYNHAGSLWPVNVYADMLNRGEGRPMKAPTLKSSWAGTEEFRAGYSGEPFGVLFTGENNDFSKFPMRVSTHLAMFLLHGTYPKDYSKFTITKAPDYRYKSRPIGGLWGIFDWLKFDGSRAFQYYRRPPVARAKPEDIPVSVFVSSDGRRALAVASNFEKEKRAGVEVSFDFAALPLEKGKIEISDAYTGEKIELKDGKTITLEIEPERYRILKLEVK